MLLPHSIKLKCEELLSQHFNQTISIKNFQPISGGCIHNSGLITTSFNNFFIKWNQGSEATKMFSAEEKGLLLLSKTNTINIPKVICKSHIDNFSFLILEYIQSSERKSDYWKNLGNQLANLHQNKAKEFGLEYDNYIGSLPQSNQQHHNWVDFFIEERLRKQILLAVKNNLLTPLDVKNFERLFKKLPSIFPIETPSLLHGDLWNGNVMTNENGQASVFDPAIYYGNREMEIAFTKLFGGFDDEFYLAYENTYPLQNNFKERIDICNLYPLLVHLNLFGGQYLNSIRKVIQRFL